MSHLHFQLKMSHTLVVRKCIYPDKSNVNDDDIILHQLIHTVL